MDDDRPYAGQVSRSRTHTHLHLMWVKLPLLIPGEVRLRPVEPSNLHRTWGKVFGLHRKRVFGDCTQGAGEHGQVS